MRRVFPDGQSRRDAIRAALTVGIYAAPAVLSTAVPRIVHAQHSVAHTATLAGTVRSDQGGNPPIAGATVTVGGRTATTDAVGAYTISNAPTGTVVVTTSRSGFGTRMDTINIALTGTTIFSPTLFLD